MKLSRTQQGLAAIFLVVAMIVSTFPMVVTGDHPPDLSQVEVGDLEEGECLTLDLEPEDIAEHLPDADNATADGAQENATGLIANDTGVPMVCEGPGKQIFGQLIQTGNTALNTLERGLEQLDRAYENQTHVNRIPFLNDAYNGSRVGGLGEWQVRTGGDKTGFREPIDPSVSHGYALTDTPKATYEHGVNTTLISPAIDLGGVATPEEAATIGDRLHELVRDRLPREPVFPRSSDSDTLCIPIGFGFSQCVTESDIGGPYDTVRRAYLDAADELIDRYEEELDAAQLTIRHRFNLAQNLDGARVEILTQPPPVQGLPPVGDIIEPRSDSEASRYDEVGAFGTSEGFTGNSTGWEEVTFDLTEYAGEQVWIVVRARTSAAFGLEGFLDEPTLFPNGSQHAGYAVDGFFVNGTAHEHNLRVIHVDAGQVDVEGENLVPSPLGNRRVDVAVANHGHRTGDGLVNLTQCSPTCQTRTLGTVQLAPGEVQTLPSTFPDPNASRHDVKLTGAIRHTTMANQTQDGDRDDNERSIEFDVRRVSRLDVIPKPGTTLGLNVRPSSGDVGEARNVQLSLVNTGNVPVSSEAELVVTDAEQGTEHPSFLGGSPSRSFTLGIGESTKLHWKVTPSRPGIYELDVSLPGADLRGPEPQAHLFIDRSPGVVCADDLDSVRSCGSLWARSTELPGLDGDMDRFQSAASAPDGRLYVLDDRGDILTFDGETWSDVQAPEDLSPRWRWLAPTTGGVLAIAQDGTVGELDRDELTRGADLPFTRVADVTVDPDKRVVVAGEGRQGIGVARGDGSIWDAFTSSPRSITERRVDVTGVASLEGGDYVISLYAETDDRTEAFAYLCTVDTGFPEDAVSCVTDFERPQKAWENGGNSPAANKSLVKVPTDEDHELDRTPFIDVGRIGNETVLLVESPLVQTDSTEWPPITECERDLADSPGSSLETIAHRHVCVYRVRTGSAIDQPIQGLAEIPGPADRSFDLNLGFDEEEGRVFELDAPVVRFNPELSVDRGTRVTLQFHNELDCSLVDDVTVAVLDDDGNRVDDQLVSCGQAPTLAFEATDGDDYEYRVVNWNLTESGLFGCDDVQGSLGDACNPFADAEGEIVPEDPPIEATVAGGTTWITNPANDARHQDSLFRVVQSPQADPLEPATVLPGEAVSAISSGQDRAAALTANGTVLELTNGRAYLDVEDEWNSPSVLEALAGQAVWTSVARASSNPADFTRFEGAAEPGWLRGTCDRNTEAGGAALTEDEGAQFTACVNTTRVTEGGSSRAQAIEMTVRYNVRELGQDRPEIRALLDPSVTRRKQVDPPREDPFYVDTESEQSVGELATGLYVALEGQLNDALDQTFLGFMEFDEEDNVRNAAASNQTRARSPHVVHVDEIDHATANGWVERTFNLTEALEPYRRSQGRVSLVGVEISVPQAAQMAIDAVWVNATEPSEDRTVRTDQLLFTDGTEGTDDLGNWGVRPSDDPPMHRAGTAYVNLRESSAEPEAISQDIWYTSTQAHRPAWAFNGGPEHDYKFHSGWLSEDAVYDRLVTPAVDLREGTDPTLSFQHAYAFPIDADELSGAGWVEAQVEVAPGVWSNWFRLQPDDGYSEIQDQTGSGTVDAFTGTTVPQDRDATYGTLYDPDNWETVEFDLIDQRRPLVGERVRFGFSSLYAPSGGMPSEDHATPDVGWVFSDLRLAASERLARDLAIQNLTFQESFDIEDTGLAPGSEVNVNATIENHGTVESDGALVNWELVAIGVKNQVINRGTTRLAGLGPGASTYLTLPITVPETYQPIGEDEPSPTSETRVFVRMSLDAPPSADEDPTNNLVQLGGVGDPFDVGETQGLEVQLDVTPSTGSPERTRAIDLRLKNTGNTPLTSIEVERTIAIQRGTSGRQVLPSETLSATTTRPLDPGETKPLASLVEGLTLDDRLWTPGNDGSYVVSVSAKVGDVSDRSDAGAVALQPYLRASVEDPTSGIGADGEFQPGTGWDEETGGVFGSAKAFKLDPSEADLDDGGDTLVLDFPPVDLSVAKSSEVSFYHRYDFEEGFDGGRLEVSLDGGDTWTPVEPVDRGPKTDYGEVIGSNPMADGNLTVKAFTGNSSGEGFDGWVFSTINLRQLEGLTEPGELATYDMENMAGESDRRVPAPDNEDGTQHVYTAPSWGRGSISAGEAFLVENGTEGLVDRGEEGFWYTGNGSQALNTTRDFGEVGEDVSWEEWGDIENDDANHLDGLGGSNAFLRFPIEDLPVDREEILEQDRAVTVTWWEWAPVRGAEDKGTYVSWEDVRRLNTAVTPWIRGVFDGPMPEAGEDRDTCSSDEGPFWHDSSYPIRVLKVDGPWRKYEADLTEAVLKAKSDLTLAFGWTPWNAAGQQLLKDPTFPGFIVDDVTIRTYVEHASGPIDVQTHNGVGQGSVLHHTTDTCPGDDGFSDPGNEDMFRFVRGNDRGDEGFRPNPAPWHVVDLSKIDDPHEMALSSAPLRDEDPKIFDAPGNADARLTLPALDLTGAEGNISLTFEHLPAFSFQKVDGGSGGGTVEVSVWDPVRASWGSWEQLYENPDELNNFEGDLVPSDNPEKIDYEHDFTGGYGAWNPAYTLPAFNGSDQGPLSLEGGKQRTLNSYPFEVHPGDPNASMVSDSGSSPGGEGGVGEGTGERQRSSYFYNTCRAAWWDATKGGSDGSYASCSAPVDASGDPISGGGTESVEHDWLNASYNLSRFTGEKVRLAFHAYHAGDCTYENAYAADPENDEARWPEAQHVGDANTEDPGYQPWNQNCPTDGARWLVDNIRVQGRSVAGQEVQMRFAAGMDRSVHNATWEIDEIEVQGTAYQSNVGVYPDTDDVPPLAPGASTTITGEVRNLGTDLRRDLALRAEVVEGPSTELELGLPGLDAAEGNRRVTTDVFTLPSSASKEFSLDVSVPDDVLGGKVDLQLELVQFNDALGSFTGVSNDEVLTNLNRELTINVTEAQLSLDEVTARPNQITVPGSSIVTAKLSNPSPAEADVRLTCTVREVEGWRPTGHDGQNQDAPILGPDAPCEALDDPRFTLSRDEIERQFRVELDEEGTYLAILDIHDLDKDRVVKTARVTVWAGGGPMRMIESFEASGFGLPNGWTQWDRSHGGRTDSDDGMRQGDYDQGFFAFQTNEEAKEGNLSVLIGISGNAYDNGASYDRRSGLQIRSPPVDLHNVTEGGSLTFWHMARLARGDGADVQYRVLVQEGAPGSDASWGNWSKLEPTGGYPGFVTSYEFDEVEDPCPADGQSPVQDAIQQAQCQPPPEISDDYNNAFYAEENITGTHRQQGYFGTVEDPLFGEIPRWDTTWELATFPLPNETLGRTAQFAFTLYTGEADGQAGGGQDPDPYDRGRGQGWFLDNIVVSGSYVNVTPEALEATILDNATKGFPVKFDNRGGVTEAPSLGVDFNRSSLTPGQVEDGTSLSVDPNDSRVGFVNVTLPRDPLALPFEHRLQILAGGILDPNIRQGPEVTLNFDPRAWPDLDAEVLEPDSPPVEGVPTIIPVQVTNDGRAPAQPTQILLRDIYQGEVVQNETAELPRIPDPAEDPIGARQAAFIPWTPERGQDGEHTLEIVVDPGQKLQEYSRSDNVARKAIDVQQLLVPDLRFEEENLTIQSAGGGVDEAVRGTVRTFTVDAGTLITLDVPVQNVGTATATNVDVRLFLGSVVLPAQRVDRLEPGDTSTVAFTFLAQEGTHELALEASSSGRDLTPEDNRAPIAGALRLVASSFRIEAQGPGPVSLDEPGTVEDVDLELENTGSLGVLLDLGTRSPPGVAYELETDQVFLGPGETATLPGTVRVDEGASGGTHPVTVSVTDPDNAATGTQVVVPVHLTEIHDISVDAPQPNVRPGPDTLQVTFTNDGNLRETLRVTPAIGDEAVGPTTKIHVPRDGERTTDLEVDVPATLPAGEHELELHLNGTFKGKRSLALTVEEMARPTITSLDDELTFSADGLTLPVRVDNLGNQPFNGRVQVDASSAPDDARIRSGSMDLEPGESGRAHLVVPGDAGTSELRLLAETEDGAAMSARTVQLPSQRPDARILQTTLTPEDPVEGEPVRLEVLVGNTGDVTVSNVPVELFIDNEFATRGNLTELRPGETTTVAFEWPSFHGRHVATASVDPGGQVPDSDPSNNAASVPVDSAPSGTVGRLVENVREVPGPGGADLLVIAAAAILLAARWGKRGPGNGPGRGADR